MSDMKAERSRLLNKHKTERTEAEKALKKAKGAMADAARKKLEELEERHGQELSELEGGGGDDSPNKKDEKSDKRKIFKDCSAWDGLSKKELEQACTERGLGKKGGKEELVVKLISFHQEQAKWLEENPQAANQGEKGKAKKEVEKESDDENSDIDSDDGKDEDAPEVSPEEAEKQHKREIVVRKALRHVLLKTGPFKLEEMPKALDSVVKNFSPSICGYSTLRKFAKSIPEKFMIFDKKEEMCYPPEEE